MLNGEIFCSLVEARGMIEAWRRHYNTVRPQQLGFSAAGPGSDDTAIALTLAPDYPVGAAHIVGEKGGVGPDR